MKERERAGMGIVEHIVMALSSLKANKMRALLTMLGIIIGISSVIAIVTVGDSLTGSITSSMQGMGVNNITVSLQKKSTSSTSISDRGNSTTRAGLMFGPSTPSESDLITEQMINDYRSTFSSQIDAIGVSESLGTGTVSQGSASANILASGVNQETYTVDDVTLITGRFISDEDNQEKRQVAVVSDVLAESIFGSVNAAMGQKIQVTLRSLTQSFYIAGVYQYEQETLSALSDTDNPTTTLYVPIETAKKINQSDAGYQSLTVIGAVEADITSLLEDTKSYFASYYTHNDSYTISASNIQSMLDSMTSMMDTVKVAIAAIAAISLLVGGIGVMNIMLVSITERTREIGTRKALGAPNSAVRFQFIVEAVIICMIAGALGVALGVGLGSVGSSLLGYPAKPSVVACVSAVLFSMAIGIFFGYYPANKAAKLDPIDALRYE